MVKATVLRRVIERLLAQEVTELNRPPMDAQGVLLEWKTGVYDPSEYGNQDNTKKRRPIVDDDLEGWSAL